MACPNCDREPNWTNELELLETTNKHLVKTLADIQEAWRVNANAQLCCEHKVRASIREARKTRQELRRIRATYK